jgi:hypothetical protein
MCFAIRGLLGLQRGKPFSVSLSKNLVIDH